MASVALVLGQYPDDVIIYITDPRTGLQRHSKWPPTVAEIIEACDARMQDLAKRERFKNWGKREEPLAVGPPKEERPTLAELKAKYGENWGLKSLDREKKPAEPAPSWDLIAKFYQADPERIRRLVQRDEPTEES